MGSKIEDNADIGDLSGFDALNVRQMQAYAAICLWEFCNYWRIDHESMQRTVRYFLSITTSGDLPGWDQEAAKSAVVGRYHDIPAGLAESIPEVARPSFVSLVYDCSEVGWVDMYGKNSDEPFQHLVKCLIVLHKHRIAFPSIAPLRHLRAGSDHWGEAVDGERLRAALEEYGAADLLRPQRAY